MIRGYEKPLFLQSFDHRESFQTNRDPLVNWRANKISRKEAVAEIARRYREWVALFVREYRE